MAKPTAWITRLLTAATAVNCSVILASGLLLGGCASSQSQIQNVPLSYNAVKTVVKNSLPGGIMRESGNGRTMTSGYFDPETLKVENEKKPFKVHAYMIVAIYGTSRPYNIDVKAFKEQRAKDGVYEDLGEDDALTDRLAERLRSALADRREDRNVIDDFRVF